MQAYENNTSRILDETIDNEPVCVCVCVCVCARARVGACLCVCYEFWLQKIRMPFFEL
jgi:hypothetical protein